MLEYLQFKNIENINNLKFCLHNKHCFSRAFTISEILVAMGIMGILAALLIPTIMQSAPDYNKVMFRKSFSNLQLAINNMVKDQVNYPKDQMGTDVASATVERGFNYTTATTNGTNKFCYFFSQSLNTMGTVTCPGVAAVTTGAFSTLDGVYWTIHFPASDSVPNTQFPLDSTQYPLIVAFDVNGLSSAPNCTAAVTTVTGITKCTTTDPDTFLVGIRYDGRVHLGGISTSSDAWAEAVLADPGDNKKG